MALTKNEALERVAAIWGEIGATVTVNNHGGAWIMSETQAHRLDSNGHPVCHKGCSNLEAKAYEQKRLK